MKKREIEANFGHGTTDHATTLPKTAVSTGPIKLPEKLKLFSDNPAEPVTVVFGSDRLGEGDPSLGRELLKTFLMALDDQPKPPEALIFYNAGAQLILEDSPVLAILKSLQHKRTEVLVCKTSLFHYDAKGRVAVGEIRTMAMLVERMLLAHHILWPK
ncbi:MAG: sulfurtransferase-like selenium metabolism protein YedF [Eubacteriales bacterium]|nr:sulfurtransferase-like selenium metabolism protein YedF [Eubacteriales bacterium]